MASPNKQPPPMANPNTPRDRSDLAARTAPIITDNLERSVLEKDATESGFQHIAPDAPANVFYDTKSAAPEDGQTKSSADDKKAYANSVFIGTRIDANGKPARHEYKVGEELNEADLGGLTAGVHYRRGPLADNDPKVERVGHGTVPKSARGEALTHVICHAVDDKGEPVKGKTVEFKLGSILPSHVLPLLQHGVHYA